MKPHRRDEAGLGAVFLVVFLIVAIVAVVAIAGITAFWTGARAEASCSVPSPGGTAFAVSPVDSGVTTRGEEAVRVLTYHVPAGELARGVLAVCTGVGEVKVAPSDDGDAHLVLTIHADGRNERESVEAARTNATFTRSGDALGVAAWVEDQGGRGIPFFGNALAHVDVELRVPDSWPHALHAAADVGRVEVTGLRLSSADLAVDVGDLVASASASGSFNAKVDVGDVDVTLSEVENATVQATADVGDVRVRVPSGPGYDVTVASDVGDARVSLPDARVVERDDGPPGTSVHARTDGYDAAPVRVMVDATADVGDVEVQRG